jgi:hypothetical protein
MLVVASDSPWARALAASQRSWPPIRRPSAASLDLRGFRRYFVVLLAGAGDCIPSDAGDLRPLAVAYGAHVESVPV